MWSHSSSASSHSEEEKLISNANPQTPLFRMNKRKKLKRKFINLLINNITDPEAQVEAFNHQKSIKKDNQAYETFNTNELKKALTDIWIDSLSAKTNTAFLDDGFDNDVPKDPEYRINDKDNFFSSLKKWGFSVDEDHPVDLLLKHTTAISFARDVLFSNQANEVQALEASQCEAFSDELGRAAKKLIAEKEKNKNDTLAAFRKKYEAFIDFNNNNTPPAILARLLSKESEEVEDFFAYSKYFLMDYIRNNNSTIVRLYYLNKNDPQISILKENVQQAENLYVRLKKFEKAYYKADKERAYFQGDNKTHLDILRTKTIDKRLTDHSYDAKHTAENTGVALQPRFLAEKVDPEHRSWGAMVSTSFKSLQEFWSDVWLSSPTDKDLFSFATQEGKGADKQKYLNEEERKDYVVKLENGKIVYSSSSDPLKDGEYIYAIDLDGKIYIAKEGALNNNQRLRMQHPSFLSGENVKCAGELKIQNGKILNINNGSGHYSPGPFSLNSALTILEKNDMLHSDVTIEDVSKGIRSRNIGLKEYREKCAKLKESYGTTFLNSVKDINFYMKSRAKETREFGFASTLFGYSGQDYYDRRAHWETVLDKLLTIKDTGSLQKALNEINNGIQKFGKSGRRSYADKLRELHEQLSTLGHDNIQKSYITKYLKSSQKVYQNLKLVSSAVNDYVGTEKKTDEKTSLTLFKSGLLTHRLKAKGKSEFLTKNEVKETEFRSSLSGRYGKPV